MDVFVYQSLIFSLMVGIAELNPYSLIFSFLLSKVHIYSFKECLSVSYNTCDSYLDSIITKSIQCKYLVCIAFEHESHFESRFTMIPDFFLVNFV